ncbi:MAG: molybdopterin-dependent oxidoreductase [Gammaproteobacteria bacterium]|nr:molybdopterin-dependent oxidoreductase [Gammaproteobacteria bacterium]MBU1653418.1 molybdopterin-dependent oxidoreductase [Gammaproteobacteria bacterium]MBU1959723.1 molybdopterin-dependent oxidoreductase [Gammaproteobacteria bacterium]
MTMAPIIKTTCPYCGVGCGLEVGRTAGGAIAIAGDKEHPANYGRLCSKGAALGETLGLKGRLLHPEIAGGRASWSEALDLVARRFSEAIRDHGPDAVAFYVSGQLLTEDYYVANKLMKGFIGSGNIDTNSRLCMSSAVAGHKRAFGSDTVPCNYEDLEQADLITLVGSNAAWCHPVLFQRIRAAKERRPGMRVVVVDPRRTATCDIADLHLPLRPGTDIALFNGLFSWLVRQGLADVAFIEGHTRFFAEALAAADRGDDPVEATAAACELERDAVERFFAGFGATEMAVTAFSQGVNQWSFGTDKVNAIINCHLATGRIGKPGAGPFSLTGQPNAMGGREVGGLANQLAAHRDFTPEAVEAVGRFWQAGRMAGCPGLKAVDLFEAVAEGRIKALWVMATNPAVSLPDADRVREALRRCEFVVVSDCVRHTDTTACAHVLLPATTWGEKEGTVTNSERRISRQRAFLDPPVEARPDWWIITEVARRMGHEEAFPYSGPHGIFVEHAALSGLDNGGGRAFDIGPLAGLSQSEYEGLAPVQWPLTYPGTNGRFPSPSGRRWPVGPDEGEMVRFQGQKPWPRGWTISPRAGTARMFADGRFFHADGRARFIPVGQTEPGIDAAFPLVLNTGRIRDQWHTMTRTGKTARLTAHIPEPFVQIHPEDAERQEVTEGALARISTRFGSMLARVRISPDQRSGSLFVPMHWSEVFSKQGRAGALVNPVRDPLSGQPQFKGTPAYIHPYRPLWHAFILSRRELALPETAYQVRVPCKGYTRYELAGDSPFEGGAQAREWLDRDGDWIEYEDSAKSVYRGARLVEAKLESCLFVSPLHDLPQRDWLGALFGEDGLPSEARASLMSGCPAAGRTSDGPVLCACFNVGYQTIRDAIQTGGLNSLEAIGTALKAGTNCGSCIPEIKTLLKGDPG